MNILLQILSTVGFVVLIILIVLAVIIACILFLPVVYAVKLKKNGDFDASGSVRWLFGAVLFTFDYSKGKSDWNLKVFGYPLGRRLQNKKKKPVQPDNNIQYERAKKQPTIKPGQRLEAEKVSEEPKTKKAGDEAFAEERKPNLLEKIKFTFSSICDKLRKVNEFKALFDKVKPVLIKLVKAVMPKKISGYIDFGFEDPANTGYLLAVLGALCIPIPDTLKVRPDFNEKKFECDVKISGRIFIIVLLVYGIKLIKIPEVKELLKGVFPKRKSRKKKNGNKKKGRNKSRK